MMQATALARFGALALSRGMKSDLVERTFRQRAAAMTTLYPRHVEYWRRLWAAVLANLRRPFDRHVAMLNSWLDDASGTAGARATERIKQPRASDFCAAPPERRRLQSFEQDLDETRHLDPALFGKVRELISDHWRYAFASGESHYAVRTTVNLCNRVLRYGVDESPVEAAPPVGIAGRRSRTGNSYTWDIWAKVLSLLGQIDAALAVRWESIRRFPESSVLRNSLAYLLAKQDRTALAEHLLRDTMEDFHDDPFCRSILANLLIRTEREETAEHLLTETMRRLPDDTVSRHTLTSMLWRQRRRGEAETVMEALHALAPDDAHVRRLAVRIREQRQISAEFAESELKSIYDNAGISTGSRRLGGRTVRSVKLRGRGVVNPDRRPTKPVS